ncbi:hypothetical protein LTR93_011925 [Exophiala xenobiotica]|nr:hypothetical protein LTR93_011925 [Exophiala xenobiotica]
MYLYPAEIMPTSIRPTGVAVPYMTQHILIIVLAQVTPLALQDISWRYFIIFVVSSEIFAVVFYFFYPETRYKTLEEIEAIFGGRVSLTRVLALFLHINDEQVAETIDEAGR